jgi:hypothetical protein
LSKEYIMQIQNQSPVESRLRTLVESDDEIKAQAEPPNEQTAADGGVVDLIFPAEDRPIN